MNLLCVRADESTGLNDPDKTLFPAARYTGDMNRCLELIGRLLPLLVVVQAIGCASSHGPSVVTVTADTYDAAFGAAVEVARRAGMRATMQDRRTGLIETDARYAGSLFEPWRGDNASFDQAVENTVSLQRRRARFEFIPSAAAESPDLPDIESLDGPTIAGAPSEVLDLTTYEGPMELRVWVSVERSYRPDQRRSTWSRRSRSTPEGADISGAYWVPVSRDVAAERRLLAAIEEMLIEPTTQ